MGPSYYLVSFHFSPKTPVSISCKAGLLLALFICDSLNFSIFQGQFCQIKNYSLTFFFSFSTLNITSYSLLASIISAKKLWILLRKLGHIKLLTLAAFKIIYFYGLILIGLLWISLVFSYLEFIKFLECVDACLSSYLGVRCHYTLK